MSKRGTDRPDEITFPAGECKVSESRFLSPIGIAFIL